ncbi:hypothetical protein [Kitasatospora viridis]|uniref:Uncharacterized protein n=1 Tax=Kitasatospora viridis TaxID=281105 RepID=A0A561SES6_9ACTN|nr:hypothetical protein [Kitasatospora viridis]TWF73375.1 hypothetical protein FHX73_16526 [Kitasatospora viridis]
MTTPQDPTVQLPDSGATVELPAPGTTVELPGTAVTLELPDSGTTAATVELTDSAITVELPQGQDQPPAPTVQLRKPAASPAPALSSVTASLSATAELPGGDRPGGEEGLRRFGPGVPAAAVEVPPRVAALWQGDEESGSASGKPAGRRFKRWLVPVLILLAVLAFLLWQWRPHPLTVTGLSVRSSTAAQGCDSTAVVTGTLDTNGGSGTVTYRWHRSDGTVSADLTQTVARGSRHTDVVLRWTFEGKGSMTATATLDVLSPTPRTAATTFTYACG